jgi:nucleotide-binding universal stress UspA family protein
MRIHQAPAEEAVAGEARKGYDMLVVGLEKVVGADGRFDPGIARIVEAFDGPLAIADARGPHLVNPLERRLNILTPVTGTEVSRRAVEIALSLARSTNGRVTALYVSNKPPAGRGLRLGRTFMAIRNEEAILREAAILADRYRTPIRTAVSSHIAPEEAILRRAERASYDLIVMGVTKRSGEELFFGNVASAILGKSKSSVLLVAS